MTILKKIAVSIITIMLLAVGTTPIAYSKLNATEMIYKSSSSNHMPVKTFNFINGFIELKGDVSGFYTIVYKFNQDLRDFQIQDSEKSDIRLDSVTSPIESNYGIHGAGLLDDEENGLLTETIKVPTSGTFFLSNVILPTDANDNENLLYVYLYKGNAIFNENMYESYVPASFPDTNGPIISGSVQVHVTNVDNPISVESIKNALHAYDETDGDVTSTITIKSDDYTTNKNKVGLYDVVFEASDKSSNKSTLTIKVDVRDVTFPIISGPESISSPMSASKTIEQIKALYSVTDNVSTGLLPSVKTDNYTVNKGVPGTYQIELEAIDISGNKASKTINVIVTDDVKPVFSGTSSIVKQSGTSLTLSEIKSQLTAVDNVDGDITSKIEVVTDLFTGNGTVVGTYTITFKVIDKAGNVGNHTVSIDVRDSIPPVWYIDKSFITVDSTIALTNADIMNLLVATGEVTDRNATFSFSDNSYVNNEKTPGTYSMKVKAVSANGNEFNTELKINVVSNQTEVLPPVLNGWEQIVNFFKDVWNNVSAFFGKVGNDLKAFFDWLF